MGEKSDNNYIIDFSNEFDISPIFDVYNLYESHEEEGDDEQSTMK